MARKLSDKDLERYASILDSMQHALSGVIEGLQEDAFADDHARRPVDNPADTGTDAFSQSFSLDLIRHDETILEEIVDARARVKAGSFGKCEGCGKWIQKLRLNSVPWARRCIECQRASEERGGR